jgi:hypothetical protein
VGPDSDEKNTDGRKKKISRRVSGENFSEKIGFPIETENFCAIITLLMVKPETSEKR